MLQRILSGCALIVMLMYWGGGVACADQQPVKIGFVYYGPVGDAGWTYSHENARLKLAQKHPQLQTLVAQSVDPKDCANVMRNMIRQGAQGIVATSYEYAAVTDQLAREFPSVHFYQCCEGKAAGNLSTYSNRMYETAYLSGALAASASKTGKIGFLGSVYCNVTIRWLNAYVLGARKINPGIEVCVEWMDSWYAPAKAVELARRLAQRGADVHMGTEDSNTVVQVAEKEGILAIGFHSDIQRFAPKTVLASAAWDWVSIYEQLVADIQTGKQRGDAIWLRHGGPFMGLKGLKKNVSPEVAEKMTMLAEQIRSGKLRVFEGPLYDNAGRLRLAKGKALDDNAIQKMDWLVSRVSSGRAIEPHSKDVRRAFLVQSYDEGNICGASQIDGVIDALTSNLGKQVTIRTHFMNTKTINRSRSEMQREARFVLQEIEQYGPDIVFVTDDNAFREVGLKLMNKPYPVVFSGMNAQPEDYCKKVRFLDEQGRPCANITGVYEKLHLQDSLRVIKSVLPDLKKTVALVDDTPTGKAVAKQLRKEMHGNTTGVMVSVRTVATKKEYLQAIDEINKDPEVGAVYVIVASVRDEQGQAFAIPETFREFLKRSTKPSLALNFGFVEMGMFGGTSVDFKEMGRQAGNMGLKLLAGEEISSLPVADAEAVLITFNTARAEMLNITIPDSLLAVAILFDKVRLLESNE